jgi:hypothetical protein
MEQQTQTLYFYFRQFYSYQLKLLFIIISAVVTEHVKSIALLQLVTFGYMFGPLPGHHQANKE